MMNVHLGRAHVLLEQHRYDLAEKELRQAIARDPGDAVAHALLGVALSHQEDAQQAIECCRQAIGLAPDSAYCHYALAAVLHDHKRYEESRQAVDQAIELDPYSASAHALKAQLLLHARQWPGALAAAEEALAIDPEHTDATNLRAVALTKLGRRDEAGTTIEAALTRDPEDATTHANMGWTLLHGGQAHRAAEHFREALRLEPDNEWARMGIVEALKARNFVYRWFLRYVLWISSLKPMFQVALLIGAIVLIQLLVRLPEGGPVFWAGVVLAIAYMLFAMTVWTAYPLFNLLLRFDRFGRLTLSDHQRWDSTWMGLALLAAGAMAATPLITGFRHWSAIHYLLLLMAAGVTLGVPREARRRLATVITLGLFAVAAVHCYRWHIAPLPIPAFHSAQEVEAYVTQRLEARDFQTIERITGFARSQQTLNNIFVWGVIAMTWLAPIFHRRGKWSS
jgi:tetratricopeptide (TPR) repeat protein